MTTFLIRRLAFAWVTLFAVLTLVFVLVRIVPGDPAQLILGDQASREAIDALRQRLGLDLPLSKQYTVFLTGALRGDWGVSMVSGQPVIGEVLRVLPWTIELTVVSLVIGIAVGVPGGVYAAIHRNRFADYLVRVSSLLGLSFPIFVAAIILLLAFAIALPWFPVISARSGSFQAWYQSITLPERALITGNQGKAIANTSSRMMAETNGGNDNPSSDEIRTA